MTHADDDLLAWLNRASAQQRATLLAALGLTQSATPGSDSAAADRQLSTAMALLARPPAK